MPFVLHQMMTMHQAKGREFKVVFLTGNGASFLRKKSCCVAPCSQVSPHGSSAQRSWQEIIYGVRGRALRKRAASNAGAILAP